MFSLLLFLFELIYCMCVFFFFFHKTVAIDISVVSLVEYKSGYTNTFQFVHS